MSRLQSVRAAYAHAFDDSSLSKIADHQFSIGPKDWEGANLSSDQQELVRRTSFAWFKPPRDEGRKVASSGKYVGRLARAGFERIGNGPRTDPATPKQAADPERIKCRSAEVLNIPSQAEAASLTGSAVLLYDFVPKKGSISTASQVGEVPNGETCVILKEDVSGHFYVQHGDLKGYAAPEHFCNRRYRLLLNLKLNQEFEDVYRRTLEAVGELGCSTVLRAFQEGRTYAHLTLNYDFEVDSEQLQELITALETFAAAKERVPLRMKGADAFGSSVIFLDVDREHEDYSRAMELHVDLLRSLEGLGFTKSKKDEKDIHWHATVVYKDSTADNKDDILQRVREIATPVDCFFDNVTIMAKVGPSQAYVGTATAAMTFPFKCPSHDATPTGEQVRIPPPLCDDLKQVVMMLHGWELVMNPHTLGKQSTASGHAGLASLISAGYDVVIPEFPANPKALGSSKDVEWAQGVCGPTDKGTYKNPDNHRKMAAYLEALLQFFGLANGTKMPIIIASSYSGYFVSAWLLGLDKEDGQPRDSHIAALVLLAGATTGEGNFLTNYDDTPARQSQDELSTVDEQNWRELANHHADFTGPLQQSLANTPVLYIRGSNDPIFPASACAYLGMERHELQMIRRSSEQDTFGDVSFEKKPLYRWEVNRKAGHASKTMAVVKDATHPLYFVDEGNTGSLQPLRDEINLFLQKSFERSDGYGHGARSYPLNCESDSAPQPLDTTGQVPVPESFPVFTETQPGPRPEYSSLREPPYAEKCGLQWQQRASAPKARSYFPTEAAAVPDALGPAQQAALLSFLRACADGEIRVESMRCRLCELHNFDPYETLKSLQGNWNFSRGWISAMELHTWLRSQPHHLAGTPLEEIASMLTPYMNTDGQLHYEGFLRMTLPKDPAHLGLRDLALTRGSRKQEGSNRELSKQAGVTHQLCQLFSSEMDLIRNLKFHRKALRELEVSRDMVLKFLDYDQGVCAGIGGLISATAVRRLLVDQLRALSTPQCDALLQRLNPSGTSFVAFEACSNYFSPPFPAVIPLSTLGWFGENLWNQSDLNTPLRSPQTPPLKRREPLLKDPPSTPYRSPLEKKLDGFMTPAPIPRLGNSHFSRSGSPISSPPSSWKDKYNPKFESFLTPTAFNKSYGSPLYYKPTSFILAETELKASRCVCGSVFMADSVYCRMCGLKRPYANGRLYPFTRQDQSFPGLESTHASTGDLQQSPRSPWSSSKLSSSEVKDIPHPFSRQDTCPRRASTQSSTTDLQQSPRSPWWASSRRSPSISATARLQDPGKVELPRQQKRPSSVPAASRGGPPFGLSMKPGRHPIDAEQLVKAVLEVVVAQAAADARVEHAKSLLHATCSLEAIFGHLDHGGKGFVADTDLWQLGQNFGGHTSFSSLVTLIHELQVRSTQGRIRVPGCLSMRDIGVLVLPADSKEFQAIKDVATDAEAKSILFLLRYSDPCPSCGMRVQRSAECAGCPRVTCPVCFTSFQCFCVVSDTSCLGEEPLSVSSQYDVYKLVDLAARAASDVERSRSRLSVQPFYDIGAVYDVFNFISAGRVSFRPADLKRALGEHYLFLSESEMKLIWLRYASTNGVEVTFPDFSRQLTSSLGRYAA